MVPIKPSIIGLSISAKEALRLLTAAETRNAPLERPQADFLLVREQTPDQGTADVQAHLVASFAAGRIAGIGIVPEVDVFRSDPYLVARSLASLDILSNGRAGFAPLATPHGSLDIGYASTGSDADYIGEFIEAVRKLWNNWQPGALTRDWTNNRYIDQNLIRRADHKGAYFSVRGPLPTPTAVQPQPVVIARNHPAHAAIIENAAAVLPGAQGTGHATWPGFTETSLENPVLPANPAGHHGIIFHAEDSIADWAHLVELTARATSHFDLPPRRESKTLTQLLENASVAPTRGVAHV